MQRAQTTVVQIGVGGLGSASAPALARGGVGRLVLVDPDRLEPSNLARQVLFRGGDLGRYKAEVAAERLAREHPGLSVVARTERLEQGNAAGLLHGADAVLDGLDSFASRMVLSDACQAAGLPLMHAGVMRFGGQALTVLPGRSTCFRCLVPEPPPADLTPDPAVQGVLGPVVGLFGALAAQEALLLLSGGRPRLVDRLWVADLLLGLSHLLPVEREVTCPCCGHRPVPWRPEKGSAKLAPEAEGPGRTAGKPRYQRQIRLREVGEVGQQRLAGAAVELLGRGPAVRTAALYLVAAGVGALGVQASPEQLDDLQRLNPEVTIGEGRPPGGKEALRVDAQAAELPGSPWDELLPEVRGALAATGALLELLGLAPPARL